MDQSFDINLYDYPAKNTPLNLPSSPNNVQGWLMGVQGYRDSSPSLQSKEPQQQRQGNITNNDNILIASNTYGAGTLERRKSISSIASEDSVNLDDLIKANYTLDVDAETDLPNLASLDLDDDSKEDFWKLDKDLSDYQALINQKPKPDYRNSSQTHAMKELDYTSTMAKVEEEEDYSIYIENSSLDSPELSWSPPDDHLETLSPTIHNVNPGRRHRSGSINSDNSLNSYSMVSVQQYSRYGMTPMIYQSDSTSTSSRTPSRLSNYSTSSQTSSNTTPALPRPRKVSATSTGMPSPSRSISNREEPHLLPRTHSRLGTSHLPTTGNGTSSAASSPSAAAGSNGRSKLAKRASHIPSPSSHAPKSPSNISGSRLTAIPSSSKSTGVPGGRPVSRFGERANGSSRSGASSMTTAAGSTTSRKLASRASHIPSAYERSTSPISGRGVSSIRNSVFGIRRDDDTTSHQQPGRRAGTPTGNHLRSPESQRRNASAIGGKPTGMRPPADARSSSRIGIRKL